MSETAPEHVERTCEPAPGYNEADASHAEEALQKAIAAGYMTQEDVEEFFGQDVQDVLIGVASYIEMAGDDAETAMRDWGLVEEGSEDEV